MLDGLADLSRCADVLNHDAAEAAVIASQTATMAGDLVDKTSELVERFREWLREQDKQGGYAYGGREEQQKRGRKGDRDESLSQSKGPVATPSPQQASQQDQIPSTPLE